ncbi:MalY/PatB family protein [Thorsellia kenyensis]|uniref:cysteine-S-conjugate beta-lyase n=1 Tax=Thorsellia kenyensis TaxID=1549888 RepID=A0ABV6C795_9GAMM
MFDFNKVVNRKGSFCTQWDFVEDRFGVKDLLPFTISDMDFSTAPCVLEALKERVEHGVFGYSRWQHNDFYQAISHWYDTRFNTLIKSDELIYSPSVIYGVSELIRMWSQEEDHIILHTPAYDGFEKIINANKRHYSPCPLYQEPMGTWLCDFDILEQQLKHPKATILILCSPHNPTGKVWTLEELRKIARLAQQYGVKIISDEIHMDMCFSSNRHIPWQLVAIEDYAIFTSASKSFNFPALGGAYGFISNKEDRKEYDYRLKQINSLSSPPIFFVLSHISAYNHGDVWLDALKKHLYGNLEYLQDKLNSDFPELNWHIPESTYLAWINLRALNLESELLQKTLIHSHRVAIMPGKIYGKPYENFIRLNVACSRNKLEKGVNALIKAIKSMKSV